MLVEGSKLETWLSWLGYFSIRTLLLLAWIGVNITIRWTWFKKGGISLIKIRCNFSRDGFWRWPSVELFLLEKKLRKNKIFIEIAFAKFGTAFQNRILTGKICISWKFVCYCIFCYWQNIAECKHKFYWNVFLFQYFQDNSCFFCLVFKNLFHRKPRKYLKSSVS